MQNKYPKPDAIRCGCKVSWNYYRDKSDAKRAAVIAKTEAARLAAEGYDFGFQCPGEIRKIDAGEFAGMHAVTLP